ncbi:MULE domain-containing protein [Aphis craccivora]|uniref:MULE domain-containing protein n=1 Tax=Aphis craccivora TaxID=307492 RepID=A0A6G0ZK88_APHCR|nr:MULE domain-containing protein [Aphis craccivora]
MIIINLNKNILSPKLFCFDCLKKKKKIITYINNYTQSLSKFCVNVSLSSTLNFYYDEKLKIDSSIQLINIRIDTSKYWSRCLVEQFNVIIYKTDIFTADYILETYYMLSESNYPSSLWVEYSTTCIRTTNRCEFIDSLKSNYLNNPETINLSVVVTIAPDNPKSVQKLEEKHCLDFIIYGMIKNKNNWHL